MLLTASMLMAGALLGATASGTLLARLPWQPRRAVPWNGWDVLIVLGAYVLLFGTLALAARWGLGIKFDTANRSAPAGAQAAGSMGADRAGRGNNAQQKHPSQQEKTSLHPLLVALGRRHQPGTLLLCGFIAVLVAPLSEEFFFRLLLQGWLEGLERRWRKRLRLLRRVLPGLLPVLLVSLLFASGHFRKEEPLPQHVDTVLALTVLDGVARLLAVAFAVAYLRSYRGATAADLGWVPAKLPRDLALGLAAITCCLPLLLSVQTAGGIFLKRVAADPFTLFFFAIVAGVLYIRTHRIVPSIAMHVAFNAMMLVAAWYLLKL